MAIPHNSKCRYGERGAAAALPKAQIILCAAKVSAASGGYSEPKQGQRSQSARGFRPRSTMRVPQPDIIEHFGNADAVPQPPERCLSRKAGIMRCCLIAIERGERTPSLKTCYQIVRCLGISADKLFYPEATLDENSATREITRMAATCTSKQLWYH